MIKIKIDTRNDAFQGGNYNGELGRILREIAFDLELNIKPKIRILTDVNGNRCGNVEYTGRDK